MSLRDNTGLLTGLLLGLTLPPAIPLWMAFLGGVVSIGLGKVIWGGLGQNLFNPALVGRAFLMAAFPTAMTTWTPQRVTGDFFNIQASNLALPFMHVEPDGMTSATPLGLMKFQQEGTPLGDLIIGNTSGSLGETSAVLVTLGGVYLLLRRDLDWRIPVSILITVMALSGILLVVDTKIIMVKKGKKSAPNEVDAITGATISSKAVVKIINATNRAWQRRLPAPGSEPALALDLEIQGVATPGDEQN